MNTLNFLMSLFNSRRTQRMFNLFRNRRKKNTGWLWISLVGLGTVFSIAAVRNANPIQRLFQGAQNTAKTIILSKVSLANMEFADEITPNNQKKQSKIR
ncbi:hypothetical protein BAMA_06685 [Bacillus manliponensis]|uniref:Uncharacterized protein n=1 Tax=Bacillus manliponensis TaxID=574376 RepID=A0A073JVK4_9BACI|nr:hypothetical protein [Bacillus manliponensis]KEK18241.1 hypothetical protein BAMA_06685 [Bacillus manliponensis]